MICFWYPYLQHISSASFSFVEWYLTAVLYPCLTQLINWACIFSLFLLCIHIRRPGVLSLWATGLLGKAKKRIYFICFLWDLEVCDYGFYGFPSIYCGGYRHTHTSSTTTYYYSTTLTLSPSTWAALLLLYIEASGSRLKYYTTLCRLHILQSPIIIVHV